MAFFDPVNQATQRNRRLSASSARASFSATLMADFEAVLVRSLATPQIPWAMTTQATEATAVHSGDRAESRRKPTIWVERPTVSIRVMPKRVASQPPMKFAAIPAAS